MLAGRICVLTVFLGICIISLMNDFIRFFLLFKLLVSLLLFLVHFFLLSDSLVFCLLCLLFVFIISFVNDFVFVWCASFSSSFSSSNFWFLCCCFLHIFLSSV